MKMNRIKALVRDIDVVLISLSDNMGINIFH